MPIYGLLNRTHCYLVTISHYQATIESITIVALIMQ